jgi:peptidoglycan glycosyltransferase
MRLRGRLTLLAVAFVIVTLPAIVFYERNRDMGPADLQQVVNAPAVVFQQLGLPSTLFFDESAGDARLPGRFRQHFSGADFAGPLTVEYSFDAELTRRIEGVLRHARVKRGHVIAMDPQTGRVLAYVSTDPDAFPPDQAYPAASLIKVVTAAAALDADPNGAKKPCRYSGNPYRLRRSQIDPPQRGHEVSLERALATSNNHCFAQLAVHSIGEEALLEAIGRFGLLDPPAPGHPAGEVDRGDGDYDLGRLGCGLAGCQITPLHAVRLIATLASGEQVEPWWVERVLDPTGRALTLPSRPAPRRVLTRELADELRTMLVRTTARGTARSAFRNRRGRPLLDEVEVAGKTGNLNGHEPEGRYEWFAGLAPAEDPKIALAVVQLHDHMWWQSSAQIAASVMAEIFCERSRCRSDLVARYTGSVAEYVRPVLLTDSTETGDPPESN